MGQRFDRLLSWVLVYEYANLLSMAKQTVQKLNQLERELPEGLLVDASWT
jgi:hypothetical protein